MFQHDDINEIEIQLNKKFSLLCDWFVDKSIHFKEIKLRQFFLAVKVRLKKQAL